MQTVAMITAGNALGEGILWDQNSQAVWWTDIEGKTLHRFDWIGGTHRRYAMPERLTAFGFVASQDFLIGAFESGFALFDPEGGLKTPILTPPGLLAGMRMNDGRVDRQGRFWAGAMVERPDTPIDAHLYCVGNGSIHTRARGLAISNGICWSPDSAWLYLADSLRRRIWRYPFDAATGRVSAPQEFAATEAPVCPDGATVDAEGYVWSAHWAGGCVVRYAPDGRVDRILEIPAYLPTCVAFGGADLDLLFVTTARVGQSGDVPVGQIGAGNVFVYNVQVRGLPESRFRIDGWPGDRLLGDNYRG